MNTLVEKEYFRIDLFQKKVCDSFSLSSEMMKRAEKMFDFNKLTFSLCSIEDVFVLKTMTEREGDLEDCFSLAKKGVDWKVILKEINKQIKISNQKVWIT